MGKLLEEYMSQNFQQLEDIVLGKPQKMGPEIPGGPGVSTFPAPDPQQPPPMQPIDAAGAPTGQMQPSFGPGGPQGPDPLQGLQAAPAPQVAPGPGASPGPGAAAPQPAFDQLPSGGDRGMEEPNMESGPDSFQGMAKDASDKDVTAAIDAMEQAGVDVDEKYTETTGSDGKGMSKKEKGLILMEFGLNLMAQSGTGQGTVGGDVGLAGAAAMKGHAGRKIAGDKMRIEAEDRKLERRYKESQIEKNKRGKTSIKTDKNGNMIVVNADGTSQPVMMDGKPVQSSDQDKLDFEVKRQAFKAAYASQIKDEEELERRAVAFANSVRQVASPDLERADQATAIIKELNKGENASQKFAIEDGTQKRWKTMNHEERLWVATKMVDMAMEVVAGGVTSSDKGAASSQAGSIDEVNAWYDALPDDKEGKGKFVEGEIATLSNGMRVRKRNGKLEEVK